MNFNNESIINLSLNDEIETSANLIKLGFGELQNIDKTNDFYFLPFQLLSQGFERLMKCYICAAYFNKNQTFPDLKYIKGRGHDLIKLLDFILDNEFSADRPILVEYKVFLQDNNEFRELLGVLSEFGKYSRYYNFDVITGNSTPSVDPKKKWKDFESSIFAKKPLMYEKITDCDKHDELYHDISSYIISILEKLATSLSLQLSMGLLGKVGQTLSIFVSDFTHIKIKDHGNTDYRKNTTRYNEKERLIWKREKFDKEYAVFNERSKKINITKEGFQEEWPFLVDNVTVETRNGDYFVIVIDNFVYALNGLAKSRYKLEFTHEAGVSIPGKSTHSFINIAKNI